jgi:hypothetical protein
VTIAEQKLRDVFTAAPWLATSDSAAHLPVAGMATGHQATWRELFALLADIDVVRAQRVVPVD